jgi:hypothetical protein
MGNKRWRGWGLGVELILRWPASTEYEMLHHNTINMKATPFEFGGQ